MNLIEIGYVLNTHGIKGELKIKLLTDFPVKRFEANTEIKFYNNGKLIYTGLVESFRFQNEILLLKLHNINDINDVEFLKKSLIMDTQENILKNDKPSLDEYYYFQLINLNALDQDGKKLGYIEDIRDFPQGAIMVINDNNSKSLVPFNKYFVLEVNLEEKYVVIDVIEGLIKGRD